jgi:hypothetical protein
MESQEKYPEYVKITRALPGIPRGVIFKREWYERFFIYVAMGGYTFQDNSSFWLTGDFVIGDIPCHSKPRCWYPGMFEVCEYIALESGKTA